MSAIVGILASATDELRFTSAMLDMLAHRGPEGDGILWLSDHGETHITHDALPSTRSIPGRATLGHRRHASMHTPLPLASADGRHWIVLDGAITNDRQLRDTLAAQGHQFTTDHAAELVLALFRAEGQAAFGRLDGPWALAILDIQDRTLLLARDPAGKRPLYYWAHRGRLAFASEIKALYAIPEIRPKLERAVLTEFLRSGTLPSGPRTLFAHIQSLPPGSCAVVPFDSPANVKPTAYPLTSFEGGDLRERFLAAVGRQRLSAREVGISLTGGIASSAIACAVRQQLGDGPLFNSFTAMVDQPGYDERVWVTAANSAAYTLSNLVAPTAEEFMAELDTLLWHQDEPFAELGTYAQWCAARAAAEAKVGVLLDGSGLTPPTRSRGSLLGRLLPQRHPEARALAKLAGIEPGGPAPDPLPGILRRGDRNAMAFGIEIRHPLLDRAVAAIAPDREALRQAMQAWLPEPIAGRPHTPPFQLPLNDWMQTAILPAFLRDITHARLPLVPLIHGGELRELVTHHLERPDPALAPLLFRLFIANRWMQRFHVAPLT